MKKNIEKNYNAIYDAIFTDGKKLSYDDIISLLFDLVTALENTKKVNWNIGNDSLCGLTELSVTGYHHLRNWHGWVCKVSYNEYRHGDNDWDGSINHADDTRAYGILNRMAEKLIMVEEKTIPLTLKLSDLKDLAASCSEDKTARFNFSSEEYDLKMIILRNLLAGIGHKILSVEERMYEDDDDSFLVYSVKTTMPWLEYCRLPRSDIKIT